MNKEEDIMKEKKKIMLIVSIIVVVILIVGGVIFSLDIVDKVSKKVDVKKIVQEGEDAIIYVEHSDPKKCKDCNKIKRHLNTKKIGYGMHYGIYDVSQYSEKEYRDMLTMLTINSKDFHYPAVIYIKNGRAYADIINIKDTKRVDDFLKEYKLEK